MRRGGVIDRHTSHRRAAVTVGIRHPQAHRERPRQCRAEGRTHARGIVVEPVVIEIPRIPHNVVAGIARGRTANRNSRTLVTAVRPARVGKRRNVGHHHARRVRIAGTVDIGDPQAHRERARTRRVERRVDTTGIVINTVVIEIPAVIDNIVVSIARTGAAQLNTAAFDPTIRSTGVGRRWRTGNRDAGITADAAVGGGDAEAAGACAGRVVTGLIDRAAGGGPANAGGDRITVLIETAGTERPAVTHQQRHRRRRDIELCQYRCRLDGDDDRVTGRQLTVIRGQLQRVRAGTREAYVRRQ